ncbi:MAG: hypothetical protein IJU34_07705 [Bacteroidales bacterium]|nr:hypothetical protein [Bacteroidales bacterium]
MKSYNFVLVSLLVFAISCSDNLSLVNGDTPLCEEEMLYQFVEAQTVLGDKIEIPYTVDNLRKALELLPPETKSAITEEDFSPTHYYVRFSPENIMELDLLKNLSPRIILSEVPLDREVKTGGIYYHDPSLPAERPTYQYATISIKRWEELDTLSVKHEILLKAFMPDYNDIPDTKSESKGFELRPELEELLRAAYKMTGHTYEESGATKGNPWYPSGYIKSYDNFAGMVPVPNVRVRVSRFLTVHETLTNDNGYFYFDSFNNSVTYKVIWESPDWDIRYGLVGQATYDGPTLNGSPWNLNIPANQTGSTHMAAMHRAANKVFWGFNNGVSWPNYSRKMKMSYMESTLENGTVGGSFTPVTGGGTAPDIQIAGYDAVGARNVSRVFSSTCHELGHATHYTNSSSYNSSSDVVKESWARFYQYYITLKEYTDLGYASSLFHYNVAGLMIPDSDYNFQVLATGSSTPVFIDLYDDYNQFSYYNNPEIPNDVISGFPPSEIESVVFSHYSMMGIEYALRDYAEAHPGNVYNMTTQTVFDIFKLYY